MSTFEPKITRVQPTTSIQTRLKAGREMMKEGRTDEALAEFEGALRLDPNSKLAHLAVGSLKAKQQRHDEAVKEFKEVLRIDPLNFQAHLRLGKAYMAKKDQDKALEFIKGAESIDPKSPIVHVFLANIYMAKTEMAKAKAHLTKAIMINPRLVRARLNMANVLRHQGELPEALSQLTAATRIEPDNAKVYEALGRLNLFRKDYSGAREAFEQATSLDQEGNTDAVLGLAEALVQENELERAEETLRKAPSRLESRPGIHKLWGDLYDRRGLYREAVEEFRSALILASGDETPLAERTVADPVEGETKKWRELSAELKKTTDSYRDKRRVETPEAPAVED